MNPVISLEKVRRIEEKYKIKFPEEYLFFITKVGNGGAGPYYELYPLEKAVQHTKTFGISIGLSTFIDLNLTKKNWNEQVEKLEKSDDKEYNEIIKKICRGIFVIGTQGCTYDNLLMLSGSEKGKIVYIDWNLEEDSLPVFTKMTFLEWYEKFFKEITLGHNLHSYGYEN